VTSLPSKPPTRSLATAAALLILAAPVVRGQVSCDSTRSAAGAYYQAGDTAAWHLVLQLQVHVCKDAATAGLEVFGDLVLRRGMMEHATTHADFLRLTREEGCDSTKVASTLAEADTTQWLLWKKAVRIGDDCATS